MRKCLFLDRDGIVNHDIGYAYKPEEIRFMPGIFSLCRAYQQAGFAIVIVTNQSGIARGYYSEEEFQRLNLWFRQRFAEQGIHITDIFHCPHHPAINGHCWCRKPNPGMLVQAMRKYHFRPDACVMLGDKKSDMQAALRAGITNRILVDGERPVYKRCLAATQQVPSLLALLQQGVCK